MRTCGIPTAYDFCCPQAHAVRRAARRSDGPRACCKGCTDASDDNARAVQQGRCAACGGGHTSRSVRPAVCTGQSDHTRGARLRLTDAHQELVVA